VEIGRAAAVNVVVDVPHHLMIVTTIVQIETREYLSVKISVLILLVLV
jgi:hypothetical protein